MTHPSPNGARPRPRRYSRSPPSFTRLALLAALALVALAQIVAAAGPVIGIDYGSEWFKVATVRPGRPLDLVLNRESKRKTHSLLTLRKGERYFGSDSAALAPRFPSTTFPHLKSLLGKLANSTEAQEYAKVFPVKLTADPIRGTVRLAGLGDNETYSVEELVAMQLAHARSQAEETLKRPINDAVITIPPFLTQVERQSMLTAANLAGLRVLALLHDETAVAINYAMTRQFPKPQHHVFYDVGAGSTVASLIKFETERRTIKATVQSVGFDTSLGGLAIDALLADHLAAEFSATNKDKLKQPLASNPRARAKLLKEAARVKTILSVNSQVMAGIESLHEDRNLRVVVTRAQLEEFVAPLKERVLAPLRKALKGGALTADKLDSLVVVGGGVRVPQIQKWLEELVGSDKIAKNVNGDEAAVLGATWRSAVLARSFKVQREIQVQDGLPYAVTIGAKGATLFPAQAPMVPYVPTTTSGVLKSVTIKKKEELVLPLGADELGSFATVYTKDLNESTSDQKLTFKLDTFGIVSITNATGTVTIPGSGGLLGIGKAPDTNETVAITAEMIQAIPALEGDELKAAESRLANWDKTERNRQAKEAARNSLESLVYSARDKSTDANMEKVATAEELETMGNAARAAGDWLDETDEDDMTVDQLKTKRAELATAMDVVVGRWKQVQAWFMEMRTNAKELNQTEAVTTWIDEYEEKDKFDLEEVKAKAGALQSQVDDKRKKEAEEAARKLAEELEKRKAEEEARRKAEAEELIRKAAEELAAKQKAEEAAAAEKDTKSKNASGDEAKSAEQPTSSSSTTASASSSASGSATSTASATTPAATSTAKPTQGDASKKGEHDEL